MVWSPNTRLKITRNISGKTMVKKADAGFRQNAQVGILKRGAGDGQIEELDAHLVRAFGQLVQHAGRRFGLDRYEAVPRSFEALEAGQDIGRAFGKLKSHGGVGILRHEVARR